MFQKAVSSNQKQNKVLSRSWVRYTVSRLITGHHYNRVLSPIFASTFRSQSPLGISLGETLVFLQGEHGLIPRGYVEHCGISFVTVSGRESGDVGRGKNYI